MCKYLSKQMFGIEFESDTTSPSNACYEWVPFRTDFATFHNYFRLHGMRIFSVWLKSLSEQDFLIPCNPLSPSYCKLFTFSSSLNFILSGQTASVILPPFKAEMISKYWSIIHFSKVSTRSLWANFNQTWHKVSLGEGNVSSYKRRSLPKKVIMKIV